MPKPNQRKFDHDKIHALAPGRTYQEVADLMGCSERTVYLALRGRPDYEPRFNRGGRKRVDQEAVRYLLESSLTYGEIASKVGCSRETVGRIARGRPDHVPAHPYGAPYPDDLVAQAREMLEDRAGYREVARTLNVDEHQLAIRLPGYALTKEESLERAKMGLVFNYLSNML